jgi:hypothetical protein
MTHKAANAMHTTLESLAEIVNRRGLVDADMVGSSCCAVDVFNVGSQAGGHDGLDLRVRAAR